MNFNDVKKLFGAKRIFALVLAVAMTVTSIPQTAYASEAQSSEVETQDKTDQSVEDAKTEADEAAGEEQKEKVQDEAAGDEQQPKEGTQAESTEDPADEGESQTGEPATVTYTFSNELKSDEQSKTYHSTNAAFTGNGNTPNYSILSKIYIKASNADDKTNLWRNSGSFAYKWQTEGEDSGKADTTPALIPKDAGKYQLVITPGDNTDYKKDTTLQPYVITGFEIKQAEMTISFDKDEKGKVNIDPGTKVKDIKPLIKNVKVTAKDGTSFAYNYTDAAESKIDYTVKVIDPAAAQEITDGEKTIDKDSDYSVEVTVAFTDKATDAEKKNYTFPSTAAKAHISVGALKATEVVLSGVKLGTKDAVSMDRSDGASKKLYVLTKTYDENAAAVPTYSHVVNDISKVDKGNIVRTEITGAAVTGKWYTAEFNSWEESVEKKDADGNTVKDDQGNTVYEKKTIGNLTVGNELEWETKDKQKAPTVAGTYVYRVAYAGDTKQYGSSSADIVLEIDPADVTVTPVADKDAAFYAGETVSSVLAKITYKVDPDKKDIWGTSYDDNGKTQPYEPVFGVYKVEGGNATRLGENDTVMKTTDSLKYEVRFIGKKAVRFEDGRYDWTQNGNKYTTLKEINDASVDSFNGNYRTKTDDATLKAKIAEITVGARGKAEIDPEKVITASGLSEAALTIGSNKVYAKVYDGVRLFESEGEYKTRADYKKATVKLVDAAGKETDGDAKDLTYRWYKLDDLKEQYDIVKAHVDVFNGQSLNWNSLSINNSDFNDGVTGDDPLLSDAGIYKLTISYNTVKAVGSVDVYFAIEPQQLRVKFDSLPTAYYGTTTASYIAANESEFQPKFEMNAGNAATPSWESVPETVEVEYGTWEVKAKAPEKEGDDTVWKNDIPDPTKFDKLTDATDPSKEVPQNKYRLENNYSCANYTFYKYTAEDVKDSNGNATGKKKRVETAISDDAEITVKPSGSGIKPNNKPIEIKIDGKDKVYDGKPYDETVVTEALRGVKYVKDDGTEVSITPDIVWERDVDVYTDYLSKNDLEDDTANVGTYKIYAYYKADDNYAEMREQVATAKIIQRDITVSVKPLAASVKAGTWHASVYSAYTNGSSTGDMLEISNVAERDQDAFTWTGSGTGVGNYSYPAWDSTNNTNNTKLTLRVDDENDQAYNGYLKSNKKYKLVINALGTLQGIYALNYELNKGTSADITTEYVSSAANVYPYNSDGDYFNDLKTRDKVTPGQGIDRFTHDISFINHVPYAPFEMTKDGKMETVYGHYATIRITLPNEFRNENGIANTAFYENALKEAGAVNNYIGDIYSYDSERNTYVSVKGLYATFNLSEEKDGELVPRQNGKISFQIVWREDFAEKFTINTEQDNLAADLRNAVAPKSLAFNAPKTKMVVGEVQDLDVKITKNQNDDLIYLDYDVDKKDVLAVSSQGRITALKTGDATVTVYPVKIANNKKVKIEGAKTAQAKITVSDVAAPKSVTVLPGDDWTVIQYPYVANNGLYYDYGYRREVYLAKKGAVNFENAIKKFEETGSWVEAGFAVAPRYLASETVKTVGKNKVVEVQIDNLVPKTDYTVYVRNVSAQRTVADKDGNLKTAALSAKGTAKDFKTTLGQVEELKVTSDTSGAVATGTKTLQYVDKATNSWIKNEMPYYEYKLSSASKQLSVEGRFEAIADEVLGAEKPDLTVWYKIPFDKASKSKLVEPKITYFLYQLRQLEDGGFEYINIDTNTNSKYSPAYTKVDKKGKLTFTQPEVIGIRVWDSVTGTLSDPIIVNIVADADSAVAKKVTLQVGQGIYAWDLVTYKSGKSVLDSWSNYFAHEAKIKPTTDEFLDMGDDWVIPVKYDKQKATRPLELTGTPAITDKATIVIKDLDPVKNIKFDCVRDNYFQISCVKSIYATGYIVDVKNASGKLVQRKYVQQYSNERNLWKYDPSRKNTVSTYLTFIDGLKPQCKYNITVTAVFRDYKSKETKAAVTTTKIPAYDWTIGAGSNDTGMGINVFADAIWRGAEDENGKWISWKEYPSVLGYKFISGNRYTLFAANPNMGSEYAVTDKLTWSSSDSKVASVSALGGTYSATLKALKPGKTVIEVKSGILKGTIARWTITVKTVGDAYNYEYFYDENEDLRGDGTNDGSNKYGTPVKLTLNVPAAVELEAGKSMMYVFTAEEAGSYKIVKSKGLKANVSPESFTIAKGIEQLITVTTINSTIAQGTITVEKAQGTDFKDRTPIKLNESVSLAQNAWGVFTAAKEGLYSFGKNVSLYTTDMTNVKGSDGYYYMKADTTIYVQAITPCDVKVELVPVDTLQVDREYTVNAYTWYVFTASEKGDYRFKKSSDQTSGTMRFDYYKGTDVINSGRPSDWNNDLVRCTLNKDEKIYLSVQPPSGDKQELKFKVYKKAPVSIVEGTNEYDVEKQEITTYTLTPAADAVYNFKTDYSVAGIKIYLDGNLLKSSTSSQTNTTGLSCVLEKDKSYTIAVDNSGDNSSGRKLSVVKVEIPSLQITDTTGKSFSTLSVYEYGWLTFTADATGGYYEFTGCDSLYVKNKPSDADNASIVSGSASSSSKPKLGCYLSANQKVWLQTGRYYANMACKVAKAGDAVQSLPEDKNIPSIPKGETVWYSYVIPESARYKFDKAGNEDSQLLLSCYESLEKQNTSITYERYWEKDSTVYFKLTNTGTQDKTATIQIDKVAPEKWDLTQTRTVTTNETKWYEVTATAESLIEFARENDGGYAYLYTESGFKSDKDIYPFTLSKTPKAYPFASGETVYLRVIPYSDSEISLTAASKTLKELQVGNNNIVSTANNTNLVKFTAPSEGTYTFAESGYNDYIYLYMNKEAYASGKSDYGWGSITCHLTQGAVVYLQIGYDMVKDTQYTITVSNVAEEVD